MQDASVIAAERTLASASVEPTGGRSHDWHTPDLTACGLLFSFTLLVLGYQFWQLGYYADDGASLFPTALLSFEQTLHSAAAYTAGRPLHMVWQQLAYHLVGWTAAELPRLHLLQLVFDGFAVVLVYGLSRLLMLSLWASSVAAVVFAIYPNHNETHFWLTALPQNQVSTILLLTYLCASAFIIRRLLDARPSAERWLWVFADVVVFPAALFTYEATFFVLLFGWAAKIATLLARRKRLEWPVVLGGVVVVVCALLDIAIKLWGDQQGGPVASYATLERIQSNLTVAVGSTAGSILWMDIVGHNLAGAVPADWLIGVGAASFAAVGLGVLVREPSVGSDSSKESGRVRTRLVRALTVVLAGMLLWFLAYAPSLLWSISPRHNYLPTVGLALAMGGVAMLLMTLLNRMAPRQAVSLIAGGLTAVVAVGAGTFATSIAVERDQWVHDYQYRQDLYTSIGRAGLLTDRPTTLILQGFPLALPDSMTPFLGYESASSVQYVSATGDDLQYLVTNGMETDSGYYIFLDRRRFGDRSLRFIPKSQSAIVYFSSIDANSVRYSLAPNDSAIRASQFYGLSPPVLDSSGSNTGKIETAKLAKVTKIGSRLELDLAVPAGTRIYPMLTAVPMKRVGDHFEEIQVDTAAREPMAVPIPLELPSDHSTDRSATYRFQIQLRGAFAADVAALMLFGTGSSPSDQLQTPMPIQGQ